MTSRVPIDTDLLEMAARLGNLRLPAGRASELVPAMSEVFGLLDSLDQGNLGETPPASAFQAAWEK